MYEMTTIERLVDEECRIRVNEVAYVREGVAAVIDDCKKRLWDVSEGKWL